MSHHKRLTLFLEIVMDVKVGEEEDGMEILGSAS